MWNFKKLIQLENNKNNLKHKQKKLENLTKIFKSTNKTKIK